MIKSLSGIDYRPPKFTKKTENVQFLTVLNQKVLQEIKKSLQEGHLNETRLKIQDAQQGYVSILG